MRATRSGVPQQGVIIPLALLLVGLQVCSSYGFSSSATTDHRASQKSSPLADQWEGVLSDKDDEQEDYWEEAQAEAQSPGRPSANKRAGDAALERRYESIQSLRDTLRHAHKEKKAQQKVADQKLDRYREAKAARLRRKEARMKRLLKRAAADEHKAFEGRRSKAFEEEEAFLQRRYTPDWNARPTKPEGVKEEPLPTQPPVSAVTPAPATFGAQVQTPAPLPFTSAPEWMAISGNYR